MVNLGDMHGGSLLRVKAGHLTCRALGAGAATLLAVFAQAASARAGDDRTISFYQIHTKETLTVQYKKDGRFVPEAMKKINWILRDWRKDQQTTMDPNTIDIIWEMHRELGSREPVHIISGYRSPATNAMLRKTRGGQATKSQHMTGKAVDISFPDVPLRRMRYSAMVRERGGVGYYPTSGIPFVHVDTARVRHWPRMVRDELALLFPSGRTKHQPADGRPITRADARAARERRKDLAVEVAAFYDLREGRKAPVQVAAASPSASAANSLPPPPKPTLANRPQAPKKGPEAELPIVALAADRQAAGPKVALAKAPVDSAPRLLAAPRPVDRPSRFVAKLPDNDRSRLDMLIKLASLEADHTPTAAPAALVAGAAPMKASLTPGWPTLPKGAVTEERTPPPIVSREHPFGDRQVDWRSGWTTAPEYDDDHPDELSYRPFALAPLLTETASFDDPALATMVHPDAKAALDMIDDEGMALPMRLGAGALHTTMAWAQAFKGEAVHLEDLTAETPQADPAQRRLVSRAVTTLPR
ncbi:DUF882 domain-containing protein [Hyphomicrobium sp. CS1GBMeth3]|uniref:DUF882 domain-containing protein n=1 Tax=Hyphomicrobium sp. CS1GBMeth3 TaxID=1892845 RepID=UPI0009315304|nr:DUF882 domain-containing protein [Hyphomicrobium sp. CS1GBMeth3]